MWAKRGWFWEQSKCECQGCCACSSDCSAFPALPPWLLQVNSSWAVINMIHHLGEPSRGKTPARTDSGGWWACSLSSLQLPPHELGTGETPGVEAAGNVKCFIRALWESSNIFAWMPNDVLCQHRCAQVYLKICVSIHYIWRSLRLMSIGLWEWKHPQRGWAAEGAFSSAWRSPRG